MRTSEHRRFLVIGCTLIMGLVILGGISLALSKQSVIVQDASFHFTFCSITQGTNHEVHSGIAALGSLNRSLVKSWHRRVSRDHKYSWRTPQATTCLSVGFRHDGDILKRDPKNGFLYPEDAWLLQAVLVQQDGKTISLQEGRAGYGPRGPYAGEYLNSWDVPTCVTNLGHSQLQVLKKKDGSRVATFKL